MPLHFRPPLPKVTAPMVPGRSPEARSPPSVLTGGRFPERPELP